MNHQHATTPPPHPAASDLPRRRSLQGLGTPFGLLILCQAATLVLVLPVVRSLFTHALDVAGMANLTDRNFWHLLDRPVSVVLLAAAGAIALVALCLQYLVVIAASRRQRAGTHGRDAPPGRRTRAGWWALSVQVPLLAAYLFLVLPLSGLGVLSPLTRDIGVPPFVTAEYLKKPLSLGIYVSAIGAVVYLNFRLVATLPLLVARRMTPLRAMLASWDATRTRRLRLPLIACAPVGAVVLAYGLPDRLLAWCATLPGALLDTNSRFVAALGLDATRVVAFIVVGVATVAVIDLLLARVDSPGPADADGQPEAGRRPVRRPRLALRAGAGAGVVAIAVAGAPAMAAGSPTTADPLVIAHRGHVWGGVENTIGALEAAATQHPDIVEVDVQQTKDGHFIASHDTNLLLLSGRNVNTYDLTLAEAEQVTVSARGFSDTIPSMVDYVRRAQELEVKLLIEPKVHHHETADYLDRFISELESVGPLDANIYHSLDAGLVESLKARRPDLQVGYTIAMTLGGIPDVDCDFLVVEQSSYSREFLRQARAAGMPVYVWTVNRPERIRGYLYDGVDGVVTDHPNLARRIRSEMATAPHASVPLRDAMRMLGTFVPAPVWSWFAPTVAPAAP
ncbi:glycerophosphoryl diester phosphodiesterase membrane domain-containing protein [Arthrobacter sp. JSM 101049]|uniref:glycerophosphoryl diester phosphodiesterase membrane domain-containing protein n=1 Tax=Arthrobacter sp. JSM 101049 TaxID=929097 RepID=UPI00356AAD34